MTLNIRGKIDRSLGKQRFLHQRERIVAEFAALRAKIKSIGEGDAEAMNAGLLELRALVLQLDHFKIWRPDDRMKLHRIIGFLKKAYDGKKHTTPKEIVLRIDEIIVVVKAQAEVT
jgi:hypothetical protein